MANEEFEGILGGATNGAATGMSTGNPLVALAGAIGGGIGGFFGGRSKKKARKKAEQRLREALAKLMAGSTDAYGNTLSADSSGRWQYNLSNSGKNAKTLADRALNSAANYQNRTARDIADDNALIRALTEAQMNKSAQSAVSRAGLRTGSNMSNALGNIARQSTNNLRNAWMQAQSAGKNANEYNINMRNNLATGASNAMKPLNSMQSNLQGMVRGLNMPTYQAYLGNANAMNTLNGSSAEQTSNALNSVVPNLAKFLKGFNS